MRTQAGGKSELDILQESSRRRIALMVLNLAKYREILGDTSVSTCWSAANIICARSFALILDGFSRPREVDEC